MQVFYEFSDSHSHAAVKYSFKYYYLIHSSVAKKTLQNVN